MGEICPLCNGTGHVNATVHSRLLNLRKARGLTQDQTCEPLGVSRSQIANLEVGRGNPTIEFIVRASAFYGVSTDYILGLSDIAFHSPSENGEDAPNGKR